MRKREFLRFKSANLIYYTLVHDRGDIVGEGLGQTLNVSMGGARISIDDGVDKDVKTIILEIALADSILKLSGRIVFAKRTGAERTEIGLKFLDITHQTQGEIADFLNQFNAETGQKQGLLRKTPSEIHNVVLILSKEHRIINDYAVVCRKLLEGPGQNDTVRNLLLLFERMEKDLADHFAFEENGLFQAAMAGEYPSDLSDLLAHLAQEHRAIIQGLDPLVARLTDLDRSQSPIDPVFHEKMDSFMTLIKQHAKNEMINLFPRIDSDPEKILALNRWMMEKKS